MTFGEYARRTSGGPPRPLLLDVLGRLEQEGEPARKTALDLGCGAGNDTLHLLAAGWTVTALDTNPEALDILRGRTPLPGGSRCCIGRFTPCLGGSTAWCTPA